MTTIRLTPRQTELLRAFFEHGGSVKTRWGRLAESIGMERTPAAVQFGHLLGKMKDAVAAPEGYGHSVAAAAPSTVAVTEEDEDDEEGPDELGNTTTALTPQPAAAAATVIPIQTNGGTPTKYNKACRTCAHLQLVCKKVAGSNNCKQCGEKNIACELVPRKPYSTVNRPKRQASLTADVAGFDLVAAGPSNKKVKTTAPEADTTGSATKPATTDAATTQ